MKTTRIYTKPRFLRLKLALGAAGFVSLLIALILLWSSSRISRPLLHQQGAERWAGTGELHYAQVSAFRSVADGFRAEALENTDDAIKTALDEAGIPDASYLLDYGAERYATLQSERGVSNTALTLVGGEFFRLHGFQFLSGAGFQPEDVMQDRVVLDELAAWQLFSSNNCVGLSVTIDGRVYQVAGVVAQETDKRSKACYGEHARAYASYSDWSVRAGESLPVTFCEAVLPEPVKDFAAETFVQAVGMEEDEVVNNTERCSAGALWTNLRGLHMQGILSNAVVYPWWESTARLAANQRSLRLVPILIFLLLPAGWAVYGLVCLYRLLRAGRRGAVNMVDTLVERRKTKKYLNAMAQKRRLTERKEHDEKQVEKAAVPAVGGADAGDGSDGL